MTAREKIFEALYKMQVSRTIDQITVDMIVRESGVSRCTFYRNFKDKYDLLNQYYVQKTAAILEDAKSLLWVDTLRNLLGFMEENRAYFRNAFKVQGQNSFESFLMDYSFDFCRQSCIRRKNGEPLSDLENIALCLYVAGSVYLIKEWLTGKSSYPAGELAQIISSLTPDAVRPYMS